MYSFLNLIGVVLSLGAVVVVGKTLFYWKGPLRGSLFSFLFGFMLLGLGFLWNLLEGVSSSSLELALFALGIALLVWGAEKIFTFEYHS